MIGSNTGRLGLSSGPLNNCCQDTSHLRVTLGISSVNAGIHSLDYYCSAGNGWQNRRVIKAFYYRHL